MRWFDVATDRGCVTRGGKEHPVLPGEAERDAQVPGARVHFDIRHQDGIDWAAHVRLCPGTRVHRLQHRFGDVARRRTRRVTGRRDPSTLANLWLEAIARHDPASAMLLYAPEASIRTAEATIRGRDRILRHLTNDPSFAGAISTSHVAYEDERTVVVQWRSGDEGATVETHLRIERGEIVEQWS